MKKKYNPLKKAAFITLITALIISQTGCGSNLKTNTNQGISKTGFYLDTICTITIFGIKDEEASLAAMNSDEQQRSIYQLITDAFKLCDEYEKILSKTIDTSDIAKINHAGGKPVSVSDTAIEVIKKGIEYGKLSDGAFDITIGKATDLWNFHDADEPAADKQDEQQAQKETSGSDSETGAESGKIPDADILAEAVKHVDYTKIKIDGNQVALEDPEMELDLGGIAKGYIADKVTSFLEEKGVTSAIVDLGGNIAAIGGKSFELIDNGKDETSDFVIGIKDPQSETGQLLGTVQAKDKTIVTSGTYERYFIADGKKYHHILNSKTGWPTDTDVLSVTILAEKGHSVDCDGLSTSCLALGLEKGQALISKVPGAEAVFVTTDGTVVTTSENIGLKQE